MGESLSNGFRYNGTSQKIKMTGLIPGENYTFSLYSQAWGSERNCTLSCDALSQIITVNQDMHHSSPQDGLLVECSYRAPGTEVEFSITPQRTGATGTYMRSVIVWEIVRFLWFILLLKLTDHWHHLLTRFFPLDYQAILRPKC